MTSNAWACAGQFIFKPLQMGKKCHKIRKERTDSWESCRLPLCQQSAHEGSANLDFLKAGVISVEEIVRCKQYSVLRGFPEKVAAECSGDLPLLLGLCQKHWILFMKDVTHKFTFLLNSDNVTVSLLIWRVCWCLCYEYGARLKQQWVLAPCIRWGMGNRDLQAWLICKVLFLRGR